MMLTSLKQNSQSKILVTGAAGLIGNAVCELLYKQKQSFVGLYRDKPNADQSWEYLYADIAKNNIQHILESHKISSVVHCAAAIPNKKNSFSECYQINSAIDKSIAEYIAAAAIPQLVYISTTNLYGISGEVITESSSINIENLYSQSKFESEQMFSGINTTSASLLRINAPYHFTQTANTVLKIFINNIVSGKDIAYHGTGQRRQDFTHVSDIAAAVLSAIKEKRTGIYNIASGNPISMKSLAALILLKVPASKSKILPSGLPDAQENHKALFNMEARNTVRCWD
jgi:UDP-glucose 4-epimerase